MWTFTHGYIWAHLHGTWWTVPSISTGTIKSALLMGCRHKTGNHTLGACLKPTVSMLQLYQLRCSLREPEGGMHRFTATCSQDFQLHFFERVCAWVCAFERVCFWQLTAWSWNCKCLWKETWFAFKESGGREEETCCRALGDDERDSAGGYELSYCKQRKGKEDEDEKRRENFCSVHFSRAC